MISLGIDQSTTAKKGIDEIQINCLIIQPNIDRSLISDGTHTFGELYKTISDYRKALKQIEQLEIKNTKIKNNLTTGELHLP